MLREYEKQIPNIYSKKISNSETGTEKVLSYEEAQKYERQQAYKKGQVTKILNTVSNKKQKQNDYDDDDWITAIDEGETIVDQVRTKIGELVGFVSTAKNTGTAKRNEEIVNGIGYDLLDALEYAEETNYNALVIRLKNNAMRVNADLDRAKTAYLEKDNGKAMIEELLNIIKGRNLTIEEAKNLDNGFDEDVLVDENGEVIE